MYQLSVVSVDGGIPFEGSLRRSLSAKRVVFVQMPRRPRTYFAQSLNLSFGLHAKR
jgi:hypothetical protein